MNPERRGFPRGWETAGLEPPTSSHWVGQGEATLIRASQNHKITKAGRDLQDHQIKLSPRHHHNHP